MSDFFAPPPVQPEARRPPRYRMPPWFGPPRGTLPAVVPLERVLARTDAVAVCAVRLAVYPAGFELDIVVLSAAEDDTLDPLLFDGGRLRRRGAEDAGLAPELLRLGIQFADGSKATNTGGGELRTTHEPTGPRMQPRGGGGGDGSWHQTQWVWPLPPPGPLVLACEWPAAGIPLTRCEIDSQPIRDAAARAQVIFSDENLPELPSDGDTDVID